MHKRCGTRRQLDYDLSSSMIYTLLIQNDDYSTLAGRGMGPQSQNKKYESVLDSEVIQISYQEEKLQLC